MNFRFFYTWRTPLMTIAYGDMLVRIKVKPGAKFVLINESEDVNARNCSPKETNTIHVGYDLRGASEYILCSPDVVESWSHDTEQTLSELKKEHQWVDHHDENDFDSFIHDENLPLLDIHYSQKRKQLKKLTDKGELFCDPSMDRSECEARHFTSHISYYFNDPGSP